MIPNRDGQTTEESIFSSINNYKIKRVPFKGTLFFDDINEKKSLLESVFHREIQKFFILFHGKHETAFYDEDRAGEK